MHGLYLLFWVQEKDVSPAIVAAAMAAGDLAIAVFEIPTGWIADRKGPRASLITGSLVQVAGMVACWLAPGIYSVVAGTLLIALGDAFRSGADQALLYRSCAVLGRLDDFRRIEARAHAVALIALVLLVVGGGAIVARWGFAAGWIAETLLCGTGVLLAVLMEAPAAPAGRAAADAETGGMAVDSWSSLFRTRLFRVVLPASFLGAAASGASFLAQTAPGVSPQLVTWFVAALALLEAAGSILSTRPFVVRHPSWLLAAAAVAVGAALWDPSLTAASALMLAACDGAAYPARAAAIQAVAGDAVRARAASLASACDMAISSITLPLIGMSRARHPRC